MSPVAFAIVKKVGAHIVLAATAGFVLNTMTGIEHIPLMFVAGLATFLISKSLKWLATVTLATLIAAALIFSGAGMASYSLLMLVLMTFPAWVLVYALCKEAGQPI